MTTVRDWYDALKDCIRVIVSETIMRASHRGGETQKARASHHAGETQKD